MIYLLVKAFLANGWLAAAHVEFLRVFNYVTFQTPVAVAISFLVVLLSGPRTIAWLKRQKIGDAPNFDQPEVDKIMANKSGTPTMGGILIIASIAVTTLLLADLSNFYVQMALVCLIWLGAVGGVDDWLKLTSAKRAARISSNPAARISSNPASHSRQGLTSIEKLLFQIGLAVVLSWFTYRHGQWVIAARQLTVPFFKGIHPTLPLIPFILIGTLVMTGASNAVNLTDGLDGLASGVMAIVAFTMTIFAIIVGTEPIANFLLIPHIEASGQMAVLAGATLGACLGFLWFNCNPAQVFMGDTGSLALGGLIGYIAIVIRQELILLIVGGIFAVEAVSVMIQVSYFKYSRRMYGKGRRIFLIAPLHHHFQRKGWTETQVVVRFWLLTALLAALSLATIKLR
jgi:phospho-N-acetylmuramoyl-pentapeptide-transferase